MNRIYNSKYIVESFLLTIKEKDSIIINKIYNIQSVLKEHIYVTKWTNYN